MKKILITGASSFVGTSFQNYISANFSDRYQVDTIDVRGDSWKETSFAGYDSLYHVAGIAHADVGHVSDEVKQRYYDVNTTLTINIAKKAKADGVKQFIFMSSSIVYGESAPIGKEKHITKDTPVNPANFYGDSKVQAESGINPLADENFKIVILRPPMIYGPGSKGNYPVLAKMASKLPVFPKVKNARSMLFVGNLVEFVRLMIENEEEGIFWPQNAEYSNTSELVKLIANAKSKSVTLIPGFSPALNLMSHVTGLVNKAFGNLTYDQSMSEYKDNYRLYSLEESIKITEGVPNAETISAMNEYSEMKEHPENYKRYASFKDAVDDNNDK